MNGFFFVSAIQQISSVCPLSQDKFSPQIDSFLVRSLMRIFSIDLASFPIGSSSSSWPTRTFPVTFLSR